MLLHFIVILFLFATQVGSMRCNKNDKCIGASADAFNGDSVHAPALTDLSLDELFRALDPDTSHFWVAVVDSVVAHAKAERERIALTNSSGHTSFAELDESFEYDDHHLLRRAFGSASSQEDPPDSCLVIPKKETKVKGKQPPNGNSTTGRTTFQSKVTEFKTEMYKHFKVFHFGYAFLRYDLTTTFLQLPPPISPFKWVSMALPVLGFKCQPLRECLKGMFDAFFPKFLMKVGKALVRFYRWITFYIRGRFGLVPSSSAEDLKEEKEALKGGSADMLSDDKDALAAENPGVVEVNLESTTEYEGDALFDVEAALKDVCIENLRFKGSIGIKLSSIGFPYPKLKLMFGTVPLVMQKWASEIPKCIQKVTSDIRNAFKPKEKKTKESDTKRYFASDRCSPHSVGLCVLLEQSRQCNLKLTEEVEVKEVKAKASMFKDISSSNSKAFCDIFEGVDVALTKVRGKIECANANGRQLPSEKVTRLHLQQGCNIVAKQMGKLNTCSPPSTMKDSFMRCRRLYACQHQKTAEPSLLRWEDFAHGIFDAISTPVQMSRQKEVSQQVATKIDEIASIGKSFQGRVDAFVQEKPVSHPAELSIDKLFVHPVWQDQCFENMGVVKQTTMGKIGAATSRRRGKIRADFFGKHVALQKHNRNLTFFYRLSHAFGILEKSATCQPAKFGQTLAAPATTQKPRRAYAMSQFMIMGNEKGWGMSFEKDFNVFVLRTPGWVSEPTEMKIGNAEGTWKLESCEGRLCGDLKPSSDLRTLRVTMFNGSSTGDEDGETDQSKTYSELCRKSSEFLISVKPFMETGMVGETKFEKAAQILEANADIIAENMKTTEERVRRNDEEYGSFRTLSWSKLQKLLSNPRVVPAPEEDDVSETYDPSQDDYVLSRYRDGKRNKLAIFLNRRAWKFMTNHHEDENYIEGPELQVNGLSPTVRQLKDLAHLLRNPRIGPIHGAGIALHDLVVDALMGLPGEMYYFDGVKDKLDDLKKRLEPDSELTCGFALVNVEFFEGYMAAQAS